MDFLKSTIGKIATALAVIALVLGFLQVRSCQQARQVEAQSKLDRGQRGAAQASGADAVNTVGEVAENQMASETLGRTNEEEIRNAQGADDRVNPDVGAAGLRALCRRAAYRNRPECRVQQPRPR
jgi:hypothetical protein